MEVDVKKVVRVEHLQVHYAGQMSDEVNRRLVDGYEGLLKQISGLVGSVERKIATSGKSKSIHHVFNEECIEYLVDTDSQLLTTNH